MTEIMVLWGSLTYLAYWFISKRSRVARRVNVKVSKPTSSDAEFDHIINSEEYKVKGKFETSK